SVGVYFGTGNLQRPGAIDNLGDSAEVSGTSSNPTSDRNIYGVVWDGPNYCSSLVSAGCTNGSATLDDLFPVEGQSLLEIPQTSLTTGKAVNGWYIELNNREGMYRNPVVFQGVAYYKTYQLVTPASECASAVGLDRVYAVDNCTTRPITDGYGALGNG